MAAFLDTNNTLKNLGTLGGSNSYGQAVSSSGEVVGNAQNALGYTHAFLWNGSQMVDLGTLGGTNSYAYGTNDQGQVVGFSLTADGSTHAFFYSSGVMYDLNSLLSPGTNWTITEALGIDAQGDIVGTGYYQGEN
jgi:probable HAF family extracellular repeat protein